jgi:osmotically inducible lipoprotein OsmB
MQKITAASVLAALVLLSACGRTVEQQAATGGLAGLAVGGPVGAAVGAGAGVIAGQAAQAN